jgi:hypothetical protein
VTLRYPYEVRKEEEYFEDIADEKIPKDMLELASHIVETKSGHFKPEKFEDHYEDALKELLRKKQSGQKIEAPRERAPAQVNGRIAPKRGCGARWRKNQAPCSGEPADVEESRSVLPRRPANCSRLKKEHLIPRSLAKRSPDLAGALKGHFQEG